MIIKQIREKLRLNSLVDEIEDIKIRCRHIKRMNVERLTRQTIEFILKGKPPRGKPRNTYVRVCVSEREK